MIGEGLSDITGFDGGGVVKGATKSVVAEAGVPEWVVPFVKLGEIIKNTAYDPIGSLMVGAAASLLDIIPLGDSKSSLRVAIASLKAQFGMEVFKPEIRGSSGGVTNIQSGLRVVNNSFVFFISNFFGSAAVAKERQTTPESGPVVPVNVPAGREAKIKEALQFYKSKGFSDTGAAYMVGNLLQESQLDPAAVGDGGRAHGLAQWRDDAASGARWLTYLQWAKDNGKEPGDFYAQLEYTIVEGEKYNAGLTMMKGDNKEDHKKFIRGYEGYSEEGNRFGYAEDILQNLTKYTGGPPNNPKTPPAPPNKILSPVEWTQISEKIEKWKKNPGVYTNNKKVQVAGLGTVLVGKEGNWPTQKPVLKYFDPTGKPMTEKEWMDKFNQLGPNQPSQSGPPSIGGPDLSPNQYTPSLNPVTSQKDTMDLNFSVETRDERAMESVEQNSISFVPILIPGQVIEQVQMVPIESMTKKDVSYIDPFSHGVKRGSKKFL